MDDATLAQFMSKVEIQPNGCWHWTGHITDDGYGTFYINGSNQLACRECKRDWNREYMRRKRAAAKAARAA